MHSSCFCYLPFTTESRNNGCFIVRVSEWENNYGCHVVVDLWGFLKFILVHGTIYSPVKVSLPLRHFTISFSRVCHSTFLFSWILLTHCLQNLLLLWAQLPPAFLWSCYGPNMLRWVAYTFLVLCCVSCAFCSVYYLVWIVTIRSLPLLLSMNFDFYMFIGFL